MEKNNKTPFFKWFFHSYIWIGILLLIIDIVSKNLVCNLMKEGDSIVLIPHFLNITYVVNRKAAFGLGFDNLALNKGLYIGFAVIVSTIICIYFAKKNNTLPGYVKAALMLIVAGAIGNMIDRIFYTAEYLNCYAGEPPGVVDFIDFFNGSSIYSFWHYVFNFADSGVVIGMIMLLVWIIVDEIKELKAKRSKEDDTKVMSKSEKEKLENINQNKVE